MKNKKSNNQQKNDNHFIPKVYISRFYDKEIEKVWRGKLQFKEIKQFTSTQIFYAYKLYNLKLLGEEYTHIEDSYCKLENSLAHVYTFLDTHERLEDIEDKKNLFYFIKIVLLTQYFRTEDMKPEMFSDQCQNLVNIYELKDDSFKKDFDYIKIEELRITEKLIKKGIKKEKKYTNELIKALQHSILPLLLSNFNSSGIKIKRHKTKKYISSDKPVVCKSIDDILNFRNFLYPLAPNMLVYSLGKDVTEDMIDDENKVNTFIYNNAISYIISHDKSMINKYMK